jgi:uncharacterized membrane protein (Fun14 family)
MSVSTNLLSPFMTQLGVGGLGGICVGFLIKKVAKIVAFFIGLCFLGLQYLAFEGIISINYGALESWASNIVRGSGAIEGFLVSVLANLPFASSFILGLTMGLKKG